MLQRVSRLRSTLCPVHVITGVAYVRQSGDSTQIRDTQNTCHSMSELRTQPTYSSRALGAHTRASGQVLLSWDNSHNLGCFEVKSGAPHKLQQASSRGLHKMQSARHTPSSTCTASSAYMQLPPPAQESLHPSAAPVCAGRSSCSYNTTAASKW